MARTAGVVVRVQNPLALKVPEVKMLFETVFKERTLAGGWDDEVEWDVVKLIGDPKTAVFVGQENNDFKSLLVITLPSSRLIPAPFVYAVYNRGTRALLKQMANEGIAFLKASGYSRFWGINQITDDATYARLFGYVGKQKNVASLLEFTIK